MQSLLEGLGTAQGAMQEEALTKMLSVILFTNDGHGSVNTSGVYDMVVS